MHRQTLLKILDASVSGRHTLCEASQKPDVVGDEVWHGVVKWLQHAQHVVQVEDRVIIPIQHPFIAVSPYTLIG